MTAIRRVWGIVLLALCLWAVGCGLPPAARDIPPPPAESLQVLPAEGQNAALAAEPAPTTPPPAPAEVANSEPPSPSANAVAESAPTAEPQPAPTDVQPAPAAEPQPAP
jgi:hypothetical protein